MVFTGQGEFMPTCAGLSLFCFVLVTGQKIGWMIGGWVGWTVGGLDGWWVGRLDDWWVGGLDGWLGTQVHDFTL